MKKVILLIIVFIFIYPVFPKFLPIPLDRVLQICGMAVLCFYPQDLKNIITDKFVWGFYRVTFFLLLLAFFAQLQLTTNSDLYFIKEVFDTFMYIFSAYLICWQMRRAYGYISIQILIYYIVLAAILQTFISFLFFFNKDLFDFYISLLKEEINQGLFERTSSINKRFMGLGSQFFTGIIRYGIAFFSILILPFIYKCRLTNNKFLYWSSVLLIAVGGLLTGRTFFAALALGIFMYVLIKSGNLISFITNNIKALFGVITSSIILLLLAITFMDTERLDTVYNFVFELFINFFESDSLESGSTDRMGEMYFFPDNLNTWFFGDGRMIGDSGSGYYMRTDIGFIRLLFYFGLPSTLFFIYVLFKYYKILESQIQSKAFKYLFFFTTIWMLVLNFKGLAIENKYYVVFLFVLVFQNIKLKNKYGYGG